MIGVEVSEVAGTLLALSVPGLVPLIDKVILRRTTEITSRTGGSSHKRTAGSRGTKTHEFEMPQRDELGPTETGTQYVIEGPRSARDSTSRETSRDGYASSTVGIYVTVDLKMEEAHHPNERIR